MKDILKILQRRRFMKLFASGTAGALTSASVAIGADRSTLMPTNSKAKKVLMKVGCQSGGTSEENLAFKARHGVYNMDGGMPKFIPGKGWDLEDSLRKRDACEKYGKHLN
mgnify:FL=1